MERKSDMTREEILKNVNEVICDVFDDDTIIVNENTKASDIDGWDSLMHITLIGAVEDEFDIQFPMKDVIEICNIGQMVDLVMELLG